VYPPAPAATHNTTVYQGPILATNAPFQPTPGSDSMFVSTNKAAQPQPINGPRVVITVVTAQFERKESPPWTRMRVGNDQQFAVIFSFSFFFFIFVC
jgi:hypothetical protein